MKKILALFAFAFVVTANMEAQEQEIFYKKTDKKTYFRVSQEGTKDKYYYMFNPKNNDTPNFKGNKELSFKNAYDKITVQEQRYEFPNADVETSSVADPCSATETVSETNNTLMQEEIDSSSNTNISKVQRSEGKEFKLRSGSLIPLEATKNVRASNVKVGDTVEFMVSRDVMVGDEVAIPRGTLVEGKVTLAKKSSSFGTKGRLGINIDNMIFNGQNIPLTHSTVSIEGQSRSALSVILFLFVTIPAAFIPGTRAEMPAGYEVNALTAQSVTISGE